jgi:hypothetical protein
MIELNIIYWRDNQFWLGLRVEAHETMAQGYSLKELKKILKSHIV